MKVLRRRTLIGILVGAVLLVGGGTYRKATRLDLHSGALRMQWRVFGIQVYATPSRGTSLSKALKITPGKGKWFTVAEREFEVIPKRISFCYTKLLGHVQRIGSGYAEPNATTFLAKAALEELDLDRDICATSGHMGRVWERLLEGDQLDLTAKMVEEIWNATKSEPAADGNPR